MTIFDDEHPDDRDLVAALERVLPRVTPPQGLFDRVLDEISPDATVVPLRRRRRGWTAGAVVGIAAAAALAIGIAVRDGGEDPFARATLAASGETIVAGEAELYAPGSSDGHVVVSLQDVPPAPAGHHYEVWVLPEGSDAMLSVGTFDPSATEDVELDLPLPGAGTYAAVDVSVEEDAGPAAHSDTSLATGSFS